MSSLLLPSCPSPALHRGYACAEFKSSRRLRQSSLADSRRPCRQCRRQPLRVFAATKGMSELQQTAANDQLIDLLKKANSQQELSRLVAENVLAFDQKFWLRVAARSDTAGSTEEKERLSALASTILKLIEKIVQKTDTDLDKAKRILQEILVAGANEKGEWFLPLPSDRAAAMREAMQQRSGQLDEAFLSHTHACMRKAADDSLNDFVQVLQKVLQLYAGFALTADGQSGSEAQLNDLIAADVETWPSKLRDTASPGGMSEAAFTEALQRRMEGTILSLKSGSYAQQVQAEYLKELETQARAVFQQRT